MPSLTFEEELELASSFYSKQTNLTISSSHANDIYSSLYPSIPISRYPSILGLSYTSILTYNQNYINLNKLKNYTLSLETPPILFGVPNITKYFSGLDETYRGTYTLAHKFVISTYFPIVFTKALFNPLLKCKTLMQVYPNNVKEYSTIRSSFNAILNNPNKFKSLYRGTSAGILESTLKYAVLFYYFKPKEFLIDTNINTYKNSFYLGATTTLLLTHIITNNVNIARTRMYIYGYDIYPSLTQTAVRISAREGTRGFSSGLTPLYCGLTGYILLDSLFQYWYSGTKVGDKKELVWRNRMHDDYYSKDNLLMSACGIAGGLLIQSIIYPFQVLRRRMQAFESKTTHYKTMSGTLNTILKNESWKGLYRGYPLHLMTSVPMWMLIYVQYVWLNEFMDRDNKIIDEYYAKIEEKSKFRNLNL